MGPKYVLLFAALLAATGAGARARIYSFVDADGVRHYTDVPDNNLYRLLKLSPERPSPTIQGQPGPWVGPFHWDSRRLRVSELNRLMAFPDDFVVLGSRREQQLQLGNAVPPPLGAVVIQAIAEELARLAATSDHLPLAA